MVILSLDPGKTTGYALATFAGGGVTFEEFGQLLVVRDARSLYPKNVQLLADLVERADIIVCETFDVAGPQVQLDPMRVVGLLQGMWAQVESEGLVQVVWQQPSAMTPGRAVFKSVMPVAGASKAPHASDAIAHLGTWVLKQGVPVSHTSTNENWEALRVG